VGLDEDLCVVLRVMAKRNSEGKEISWMFCNSVLVGGGFSKERFLRAWFELKERGFIFQLKHNGRVRPCVLTQSGFDFLVSQTELEAKRKEEELLAVRGLVFDQTSLLDSFKRLQRGEVK